MTRTLTTIAAAATLAIAAVAAPAPAQARGGAIAAGVLGGLAAGAIIGGAAARPYGYYDGPYYGAYAAAPCGWRRERVWDGFGWRIRRVRVCY